ncbi:PepSY domain-containing protein [Paenibacillus sp. IB182496]|uniref:PepSY domain-containing protein n=2 Tax=Paenibacillus sabuli TaxID=2772509 RepID=A0A927GUI0_9BACL|nr:PepSY domain-containing protein [Paenibacillus sabuli]
MKGWVGACAVVLAAGSLYGIGAVQAAQNESGAGKLIGVAKAEALALEHASGHVESIELERSGGTRYYEVELDRGATSVEVRIEAYTGKLLGTHSEREDDDDDDDLAAYRDGRPTIGAAKAVEAALAQVPGTATEVDLDEEDGVLIYEVDVRPSGDQARGNAVEVGVDAVDGSIVYADWEHDDDRDDDDDRD